jgi:hypothetical protein
MSVYLLERILCILELIYGIMRPRLSATLHLTKHGGHPVTTILVGKTAQANWQEWSGPNGTGDKLPPAGAVTYTSSDAAVATVDPSSGLVTGVALGSAVISGTDAANSLTASDTINVTEVAQSATLTLTAN